jgi:hypothetical protein
LLYIIYAILNNLGYIYEWTSGRMGIEKKNAAIEQKAAEPVKSAEEAKLAGVSILFPGQKHNILLMKTPISQVVALALMLAPGAHGAEWFERLFGAKTTNSPSGTVAAALSQDQIVGGLKEALGKGVEHAIASLGKPDGFLKDLNVKIPMPESLQKVDKTLRMLHQDKLADDFVTAMNRAAEQAVPEAAAVVGDSLKQMSISDAKSILAGTNNAATEYFRRTSETNLHVRFLPIVKAATDKTGVTGAYKRMTDKASGGLGGFAGLGASLLGQEMPDLDDYVTRKAIDGLFLKIGEQEKQIRENPVARTTDLLKQVFGTVGK